MDRFRVYANLSTLANALVGVGAVLYLLAGNKLWAMLLIVSGVAFDGLDGLFSRRSLRPSGLFGRVADSAADAITFGVAPAFLVIVHTDHATLWSPYATSTLLAGLFVGVLALTRLVVYTLRAFEYPHFVGAPTPQTALALVTVGLFVDNPAFVGTNPTALVVIAIVAAVLMVVPLRFPKIRRGGPLRGVATVTALGLVAALLPLQFRPAPDSILYVVALVGALVAAGGTVTYYLYGPLSLRGHGGRAP